MLPSKKIKQLSLVTLSTMVLAGCGGDDSSDATPPVVTPVAVACSVDTTVALAYEEQRLGTSLPITGRVVGTDATPFADRILAGSGLEQRPVDFAAQLCPAGGQTTVSSYDLAVTFVKDQGAALWKAAVARAQTTPPTATSGDDRPLYWARVKMTKALRQWKPAFTMTAAQLTDLQLQFERSSRGQYDINLPAGSAPSGAKYRRLILSGFDVFTLGTPGTPNTGMRNGNPSGATALALDGKEFTLPDGTILHVETYMLPVSYDPFNLGMQEDTIGPFFRSGPQRVDASISMSQGSANIFNLEQWNGRFHGPSAGNDGMVYCPSSSARLPSTVLPLGTITAPGTAPVSLPNSGCDIDPPARWLGYESGSTWMKDFPPQFTTTTLPIAAMVTAATNVGIPRPPGATSAGTEGFDVTWHTNYNYFEDCNLPATKAVAWTGVVNTMPAVNTLTQPDPTWCSRQGGGGDYLSNESAYRNTTMRDVFSLDIPAGHIHVPVLNNFLGGTATTGNGTRDDNAVSDTRFEAYRSSIVAQAIKLVQVVGNSLAFK